MIFPKVDLSLFNVSNLRIELRHHLMNRVHIDFRMDCHDLETRKPILIATDRIVSDALFSGTVPAYRDPQAPAQLIRHIVRETIFHEIDECLLIDGKRVFDPHAKEKR